MGAISEALGANAHQVVCLTWKWRLPVSI